MNHKESPDSDQGGISDEENRHKQMAAEKPGDWRVSAFLCKWPVDGLG